jgi:hypothetical protein
MKTNWHLGETRDYSMFNFVESNREINKANLKKIEESILDIGVQVPIVVNSNYDIIEGQHRFLALKSNKMPVPYIVSRFASKENIAKLQESKKWSALDYCKSWSIRGNKDCKDALEIANKWHKETNKKLSMINILELLMDAHGYQVQYRLKNNKYSINKEIAEQVYDCIKVMNELETGTNVYGNKIVRTMKKLHYDLGGLDADVVAHMTKKNFIMAYSNEHDQFNYMKKLYLKSLKAIK